MLSTTYRIKLEEICNRIATHQEVSFNEMVWCEKLSSHNAHAAKIMRQARRTAANQNMVEGSMDDFLNQLDIGGTGFDRFGKRGFRDTDDMVDWWTEEKPDDWRQRD